jgi:hypothetical protein
VVIDRSSTSVWNVASVTSITVAPLEPDSPVGRADPASRAAAGEVLAAVLAGSGAGPRKLLRSTAPRVKIDEVVRGSLMVT